MLHVNYSCCNCYDCENKNKKIYNQDPILPVYIDCDDCPDKKINFHKFGIPTNMSIRNGDFNSYFVDDNYETFKKKSIDPSRSNEYSIYNKNCLEKSHHPNFVKVDARNTKSYANLYDKNASLNEVNNRDIGYKSVRDLYTSTEFDGRLVSVPYGGQIMALDRPPLYKSMPVNDSIYNDPNMNEYRTKVYKDYTDINAGSILYYFPTTSSVFSNPNYTIPKEVEGILFKDPMGAILPYYNRTPIKNYDVLNTKKNNNNNRELTWMRDSQEFRENIMSLQYSKINKTKFNPRYIGNIIM